LSKNRYCAINKTNKYFALGLCLVILVSLTSLGCLEVAKPGNDTIKVQILAINDFHGQLSRQRQMVTGYNETGAPIRVDAGGAEYLAAHIKSLSSENPNTFVISGGDSIGASPLVSAMFHDEPTIKALNMMDLISRRGQP